MKKTSSALIIAGGLLLSTFSVSAQEEESSMPAVPVDQVEQAIADSENGSSSGSSSGNDGARNSVENNSQSLEQMKEEMSDQDSKKLTVPVSPGVNEIIPIAINHLNRVLVPFPDPQIRTTSTADYQIHDRAIYVTTSTQAPVTMYITNGNNESVAISLTLVPRRIAPVEATVDLDTTQEPIKYGSPDDAEQWEESQPYVDTLRELMKTLARGGVPQGYSMSETSPSSNLPDCFQPGMEFDFINGQFLEGRNMQVNVGVVENSSNESLEFVERSCSGPTVAAVASWPNLLLEPGQSSEVYVVTHKNRNTGGRRSSDRPSLIGE